jgi:hypothetical protein
MKRISFWFTRGLAVSSAVGLAGVIAAFASCATNIKGTSAEPDSSPLPEASAGPQPTDDGGSPDAAPDCDAGDPSCTTSIASCDTVSWCMASTPAPLLHPLLGVWGSGKTDVWAVGSGGTILHYDGTAWTDIPSGLKYTLYGVWGSGANDVWVVATTSIILHGTGIQNGTATWTNTPAEDLVFGPIGKQTRAIWGSSADDVRLGSAWFGVTTPDFNTVGNTGQLVKSVDADGGATWRPVVTGQAASTTSIWGSSPTDVWMTGDNSQLANYERGKTMHGTLSDADAGSAYGQYADSLTWTSVDSQSNVTLDSIWGSSAADVWAVGAVGTIRHIVPGDIRWEKVASPTIASLHSVWGTGPNDIWAVGDSGTILHWDGTSFTSSTAQFPLGNKPNLYAVWGSGPDDVWIGGEQILLHYTGAKSASSGGSK